ncbi:hypothetical protein [Pseudoalteromonas pernae]|uniref:hypothetical protein n=1 Tax=Pseudoalteromonas pernae TaxID=3118054 RepID=UPI0032420178
MYRRKIILVSMLILIGIGSVVLFFVKSSSAVNDNSPEQQAHLQLEAPSLKITSEQIQEMDHSHDFDNSHHGPNEQVLGSGFEKNQSSPHSHKVADIKKRLCEDDSDICTIKEPALIEKELIDGSLNLEKSKEVGVLLSSSNFNEVIELISNSKVSTESIQLQDNLNQQLLYDYLDINSQGVFCSDLLCGATFNYENSSQWESFQKDFFIKNEHLGNLYIAHFVGGTRVVFFPSNESKAVIR